MTATLDRPSEAAILATNDLCFEAINEICNLAASYARSAAESAYRGDHSTLRAHLLQLGLTVVRRCRLSMR